MAGFEMSERRISPFHFRAGPNEIGEDFCSGALDVDGHAVSWDLQYRSTFRVTLSSKGWIGFSRTPHSDAVFSGHIMLDRRRFAGDRLGFGVQGHNCGYRHRNFWNWMHAYFPRTGKTASTLEALFYEMPLGLVFRKAVLWHDGQQHAFRKFHEIGTARDSMRWNFQCADEKLRLETLVDGSGAGIHRLPYVKTDCSGSFEVKNNSLASASLTIENRDGSMEQLETSGGAVLEIVG